MAIVFDKGMRQLDIWDLGLTKLAVACFVLAVIAGSPKMMRRVQAQNSWLLLLAALILGIRPTYRFFRQALESSPSELVS
jgi:hypothetical protein